MNYFIVFGFMLDIEYLLLEVRWNYEIDLFKKLLKISQYNSIQATLLILWKLYDNIALIGI